MAARSIWTGSVQLHALMAVQVAVYKATDEYEGSESLREVCACHGKPLVRATTCVGGRKRLTEEAASAGATDATHAKVVKAIEVKPDEFKIVDPVALDAIGAAVNSDVISVEAVVPYDEAPMEFVTGTWYLRHNKKLAGSQDAVVALAASLRDEGSVVIGRWAHHGHEHVVAIHTVSDVLVMNRLAYNQEVRDPDPFALDLSSVDAQATDLTKQLLATFPSKVDIAAYEDQSVQLKAKAIAAAVAGKTPAKRAVAAAPTGGAPDLLGSLQAALGAAKKPAAKSKSAAKKPPAKGRSTATVAKPSAKKPPARKH